LPLPPNALIDRRAFATPAGWWFAAGAFLMKDIESQDISIFCAHKPNVLSF